MSFMNTFNAATRRLKPAFIHSSRRLYSLRHISEESEARYCIGGYHPVKLGDSFNHGRYKVISKLGYGRYSTVWLVFDHESRRHVALKILTADSFGHGKDTFEIDILKHVREMKATSPGALDVPQLLDNFQHVGPHGVHACLVFPAMGPDMSTYRQLFSAHRIPLPAVKTISRQLLFALSYLHDTCRVIHTDIKPQNILLETSAIREMFHYAPSEAFKPEVEACDGPLMESIQVVSAEEDIAQATDISVTLGDFGTASWFDKHLTEWIQPQMLRAPEVTLGAKWDSKVDIWNLGLIIWELAEGQILLDGKWTANAEYSSDAHLAQITAVLGNMPQSLLDRSQNRSRYFEINGNLPRPSTFLPCSLEEFSKNPDLSSLEKKQFLEFIRSMVRPDPAMRLDARSLLQSAWLA